MKMFCLVSLLLLSSAAHAADDVAPNGLHCRYVGKHRTDDLSLTPVVGTAADELDENEHAFILSGQLNQLGSTFTSGKLFYKDENGQPFSADEAYALLPVRFRCLVTPQNPHLFRCDQIGMDSIVFQNLKDQSLHPIKAMGEYPQDFSVTETIRSEVNGPLQQQVTRSFEFHFDLPLATEQFVRMDRSVDFQSEACELIH